MAASGIASVGGGAVGQAVVKKAGSKGAIKAAAKAITKVASSKLIAGGGGGFLGAAVRGFVGSVVPFVGTGVGAAIGGAAGSLVGGVAADKLMLALDAYLHREEFRSVILDAVLAQQDEMIRIFGLSSADSVDSAASETPCGMTSQVAE